MKKKVFYSMFVGALLTTANMSLVSCSDYDDDIKGLQEQINALVTQDQLAAKAAELRDVISKAQTDFDERIKYVGEVAEAARKTADEITAAAATKEELSAVAAAAQKAAEEIAAKAATKDELAAAAESAKEFAKKLEGILENKANKDDVQADIAASKEEIINLIEEIATEMAEILNEQQERIDDLDERLKLVEQAVGEEILEDLSGLNEKLKAIEAELKDIIGAYSTMVTTVQLFFNTGNEYGPAAFADGYDGNLFFAEIQEKANTFPMKGEADGAFSFKDGEVRTLSDSILVRVLPVDAVLTASNISLMNSQCAELNDLIEVESVHRYSAKAAPVTRSGENNGLWIVKFKPKDNYDANRFEEMAVYNDKSILYCLAVKNTDAKVDADRRVVSEFGLSMSTGPVEYGEDILISQGEDSEYLNNIYNRYVRTENGMNTDNIPELDWIDSSKPSTAAKSDNSIDRKGWNSERDYFYSGDDNRQGKAIFVAKTGQRINIKFNPDYADRPIKGFYVMLDYKRALESAPSELNAWNSYTYENVGKQDKTGKVLAKSTLQYGNEGYINIKDLNGAEGDVIGFRIFAVNLDGTLVDPDGKAFYVGLGIYSNDVELEAQNIAINYDEYKDGNGYATGLIDVEEAFACEYSDIYWSVSEDRAYTPSAAGGSSYFSQDIKVLYYDADGKTIVPASAAKKMRVVIMRPSYLEDNYNYTLTGELRRIIGNTYYTTKKVNVDFVKTMPTEVPELSYITQQTKYQVMVPFKNGSEDYQVEVQGVDGKNTVKPKYGYKDLNNVYIFNKDSERFNNDANFCYSISNADYVNNDESKGVTSLDVLSPYKMYVKGQFVDNKTEHSVKSSYIYMNISKVWDNRNNTYIAGVENDGEYIVTKNSNLPLIFMSWAAYNVYEWPMTTEGEGEDAHEVVNIPVVKWSPAPSGVAKAIDLRTLLVKNSADAATFSKGNLAGYLSAGWLKIIDAANDVYTQVDGQKNPYFKVEVSGTTLNLKQTDQSQAAPSAKEHTETLYIKVYDCFGIAYTITLPIKVQRD